MDKIEEILTRGVERVYPSKKALAELLKSGKKIRLYQGFDPSMPSLHLGNLVGLMKLRQFQKLGHEVIFLVGDFTGMIGDPTDKTAARKTLTREETAKNSQTWKEQAGRVLDFTGPNPVKIMFNSTWNDKKTFKDLIEITSHFTVQQMIERDMFQKRISEGKPIHLHEFLYPVAQAIDNIEMDVDLEVGGNDQTFNMLAGRQLMKSAKGKEKLVLTTKLLVDPKGNKIGKTTGNALFLDSNPENFFGGIMSFPDKAIEPGFELLTEVSLDGVKEKISENPMETKKELAYEVVKLLWGKEEAKKAQEEFKKVFQNRELPENVPNIRLPKQEVEIAELLVKINCATSNSEAKRLVKQGAVEINGEKITSHIQVIMPENDMYVRVGKTRFVKIEIK